MEALADNEIDAKLKALRDLRSKHERLLRSVELTRSDYVPVIMKRHRQREEKKTSAIDSELKTLRDHSARVIQRTYRRYRHLKRVAGVTEQWSALRMHPSIGKSAELFEQLMSRGHPTEYISLQRIREKMVEHENNRRKEAEKFVNREDLIRKLESLYGD